MNQKPIFFLTEKRIELNQNCGIEDVCKDAFAQCRAGLCKCRDDYYDKSGVCSK